MKKKAKTKEELKIRRPPELAFDCFCFLTVAKFRVLNICKLFVDFFFFLIN